MPWSAIGSVVGGVIQSAWNNKMQREAQDFQRSERIAGQEYQTSEREAMQQYQTGEREAQNQYAEDMYNKYESPEARVRQLKAAGLNPILASDNSGVGSVAASSGSSGGAPGSGGAVQGHAPSAPYQSVGVWSDIMGNAAKAIESLASAKEKGVNTELIQKSMDGLVKKVNEEARSEELKNAFQEIINSVNKNHLDEKFVAEINSLWASANKDNAQVKEIQAMVDKLVEEKRLTKMQADTFMEAFKNTQDNIIADTNLKDKQAITESGKPALQKSEISRNFASATLMKYQAEIEKNFKPRQIQAVTDLDEILYNIHSIQYSIDLAKENGQKEFNKFLLEQQRKTMERAYEIAQQQLKLAEKENDTYSYRIWTDIIRDLSDTFKNGAVGYRSLKGFPTTSPNGINFGVTSITPPVIAL